MLYATGATPAPGHRKPARSTHVKSRPDGTLDARPEVARRIAELEALEASQQT